MEDFKEHIHAELIRVGFTADWTLSINQADPHDIGFFLSRKWTISEGFEIESSVSSKIAEIAYQIKEDILNSPVVREKIENRDAIIAELECTVRKLEVFRTHYKLAFEEKHGRPYDLQKYSK